MKTRLSYLAAAAAFAALCAPPLAAEEPGSPAQTQRERFAACAHETRGMKPEQHREYMSECLRKHAQAEETAGGGRLQPCNAEADRRKLHGDERSAFIGACLKG